MAADQTGIDPDGLYEGVFGTLDGVFHLGRVGASAGTGFDLKGHGPCPGKQHHAVAVNQLLRHSVQIFTGFRHAVIDRPMKGSVIEILYSVRFQVLRNGSQDVFRHVAAGDQPVNGIGMQRIAAAAYVPGNEIPGIRKHGAYCFVRHSLTP